MTADANDTTTPAAELLARIDKVLKDFPCDVSWSATFRRSEWKLIAAALRCSPVSGWQPIDTAPKDGSWLIVSNGKYMDVARWSHGSFGGFSEDGDVLHWQPLPPLPSGYG